MAINRRHRRMKPGDVISASLMNDLIAAANASAHAGQGVPSIQTDLGTATRIGRSVSIIVGFLDEPISPQVNFACMSVYFYIQDEWKDSGINVTVWDRSRSWEGDCGDFVVAYLDRTDYQVVSIRCIEQSLHTTCVRTDDKTQTDCGTIPNILRASLHNVTGCAGIQPEVTDLAISGSSWRGSLDVEFGTISLAVTCAHGTWELSWQVTPASGCSIANPAGTLVPSQTATEPLQLVYSVSLDTTGCAGCADGQARSLIVRVSALDSPKTCDAAAAASTPTEIILFEVAQVPLFNYSCKYVWGQIVYKTCGLASPDSSIVKIYDRAGCFFNAPAETLQYQRGFAAKMTIAYTDIDPAECIDDTDIDPYGQFATHECCDGCCWIVFAMCNQAPCQ